jgi:regulator of sigma E protease
MTVFLLILGLFLIIALVCVHEWGHFIVARRNGVEVEEYGIFFPPRIWHKKTKGGWDFSINSVPLGGFVRLKGAHDRDKDENGFGGANLWVKTKIMLAGVFMNLVAAFVILTILAFIGIPQLIDNQYTVKSDTKVTVDKTLVGSVIPKSPAASIGLKSSDQLISIGNPGKLITITKSSNLPNLTKQFSGKRVEIVYKRGDQTLVATTTLLTAKVVNASLNTNNPKGYLGVSPFTYIVQRSTWSSPIAALGIIRQYTALTFKGLGSALSGFGSTIAGLLSHNEKAKQTGLVKAESQVSGPIGIYNYLKYSSAIGIEFVLLIVAVISLTLAIMNTIPIPALDGGRLFIIYISRLIHVPFKQTTEDLINGAGFAVLMVLVLLISIVDVKRFY